MTMSKHVDYAAKGCFAKLDALVRQMKGGSSAQSAVEFAFALPVVLMLLVVGIQFAIIGEASLALGQVNYQGARYAAIYTNSTQAQVQSYMLSVASPTISANGGTYLTSTVSPAPPCTYGSSVTVSVSFNAQSLLTLPNPFLGITFPTTLTSSESAFCEGSTN
jgi:Flp pilus assembly protein TadG